MHPEVLKEWVKKQLSPLITEKNIYPSFEIAVEKTILPIYYILEANSTFE